MRVALCLSFLMIATTASIPPAHSTALDGPATPTPCGKCKATVTDHTAGTDGSGSVIIEIQVTSSEKGVCFPQGDECSASSPCKMNFNIFTPAGSTVFTVRSAEVDGEVDKDDVPPSSWTEDSDDRTGNFGFKKGLSKTAACENNTYVEVLVGSAVATATLGCGACDEDEL